MGNKILVVGATSKIGAEVVKALVDKGENVKAGTRRPTEYRAAPGVQATHFDYEERASLPSALEDVDRVFMVSMWTDPHPELKLYGLVESARAAGVKHIVLLTSQTVDPAAAVPLGRIERRIEGSGVDYTFLRPNWFMQNFTRGILLPAIRNVSLVAVPAAGASVSFVDTRDIAAVVAAAFTDGAHKRQAYDLTGGEAVSYVEAAHILAEVLGRRIAYQDSTEEEMQSLFAGYAWEAENVDHVLKLFEHVRAGMAAPVSPTLGTLLGRAPTTFRQFAEDHRDAWR